MQVLAQDTVVQGLTGLAEPRTAGAVAEWRLEQALHADAIVLSVLLANGDRQSLRFELDDARDIGEVLRRRLGYATN